MDKLDKHEMDYADGLLKKLQNKKEKVPGKPEFRDFQTGCGGQVRVWSDGRIEQI